MQEELTVNEEIKLSVNQLKAENVLVRRGNMAKDFEVYSGEMFAQLQCKMQW